MKLCKKDENMFCEIFRISFSKISDLKHIFEDFGSADTFWTRLNLFQPCQNKM